MILLKVYLWGVIAAAIVLNVILKEIDLSEWIQIPGYSDRKKLRAMKKAAFLLSLMSWVLVVIMSKSFILVLRDRWRNDD